MPVLFEMSEVPDRIFCDLLKAAILPTNERLEITPLTRWLCFLNLPNKGFISTERRVIIYRAKPLIGLAKHVEFSLTDIEAVNYAVSPNGFQFQFLLTSGEQHLITMKLTPNDCNLICERLRDLVSIQKGAEEKHGSSVV